MPQLSQAIRRRLHFAVSVIRQNNIYDTVTKLEKENIDEAILLNNELTPKIMITDLNVNTYTKKQQTLLSVTIAIEKIVKKYTNVRCG